MNSLFGITVAAVVGWMMSRDDDDNDNGGGKMLNRIDRNQHEHKSQEYWGMKMLNCTTPMPRS